MHGGDLVVQSLKAIGVTKVFGLPGAQTNPIYDAIGNTDNIEHLQVRDERSGAFAADAYARVTGKIGVCDATYGPGATNLPSGLFEAYNSSVPVLALVGGPEQHLFNHNQKGRASQGIDQLNMLQPVSKHVISVTSVDRIPETIRIAAIIACSGTPGPVVVEFPANLLRETVDQHLAPTFFLDAVYPLYPTTAPRENITKAAEIISHAKRPVIVAGGGVLLSGAENELTQLISEIPLPVLSTYSGKGAIPDTHPMSLGLTGNTGIPTNEKLARNADLVILIGVKNSQNVTYNWTFPEKHQTVIHIDIDPEDINRIFESKIGLLGDARLILKELRECLAITKQVERAEWLEDVKQTRDSWQQIRAKEFNMTKSPIAPQRVMKAIQSCLDENTCVVADASFSSAWVAEYLEQDVNGRHVLYPRGSGGLGWSLPAAIGACASGNFKKVIVVAGDGGYSYSVNELATLRQHGYEVVSVILNNSTWGWMKWLGNITYEQETPSTDLIYLDYAAIANGFGLPSAHVEDSNDLEGELSRLLSSGQGGVMNVITAWDESPDWNYRNARSKKLQGEEIVIAGYVTETV